jgi:hypothetical protein
LLGKLWPFLPPLPPPAPRFPDDSASSGLGSGALDADEVGHDIEAAAAAAAAPPPPLAIAIAIAQPCPSFFCRRRSS